LNLFLSFLLPVPGLASLPVCTKRSHDIGPGWAKLNTGTTNLKRNGIHKTNLADEDIIVLVFGPGPAILLMVFVTDAIMHTPTRYSWNNRLGMIMLITR